MGSRTCDIAGGCTMLSSRMGSALFVFFCFAIMTDEVLTTPDEVSELGEWLGAGRGGNLAANANGMLAAIQRKIQRKAQGRGPDPRATEEIKSAAAAAAKKAQTEKESTAAAETAPADWRPKRPKRSTRTPWPASVDTSPTSGGYTVESDKWKTKVRQSNKGTDKATVTGAQLLFGRAEAVKWNTASKLAFSCGIGNTYAAANEKRAAAAAAAKKATADAVAAKAAAKKQKAKNQEVAAKKEEADAKKKGADATKEEADAKKATAEAAVKAAAAKTAAAKKATAEAAANKAAANKAESAGAAAEAAAEKAAAEAAKAKQANAGEPKENLELGEDAPEEKSNTEDKSASAAKESRALMQRRQ